MAMLDKTKIIEYFGCYISSGKAKFFQQDGLDFVPGYAEGSCLYILKEKPI